MITITALADVPAMVRGHVKDLRVRWALNEAGLPYRTRLLAAGDQAAADYRAVQPFGQVPAFEEDGLALFESGAIVLRIADRTEALLPRDEPARARAVQWVFAALNSIEPFTQELAVLGFHAGEDWARLRRPGLAAFVHKRLGELSRALADKPFLDGDRFTAGDLMMATVLRSAPDGAVSGDPGLAAYVARCTSRPAFAQALASQLADFSPLS